ncbi:MAG: SMI1/KNR4 family protein [Myxococcales bacterium]|nr:SMI1/KNR4 family protein [Myxococcales bacterium]
MQLDVPALERVVAQYRHDVNELAPPAPTAALRTVEKRLDVSLPVGLHGFLTLHNGAGLFRGAIRVRGTSQLASASEECPHVILFAEVGLHGRAGVAVQWAFAATDEGAVFGRWEDGELQPVYGSFAAWLAAEIAVVEADGVGALEQARIRGEAARTDAVHTVSRAQRLLRDHDPAGAVRLLRSCVEGESSKRPDATLWQVLGDALDATGTDPAGAWRRAFERCALPLPWPGAPCPHPEAVRRIVSAYSSLERWEAALHAFLGERVSDVRTTAEVELVGAVVRALAQAHLDRADAAAAHALLTRIDADLRASSWGRPHWGVLLDLAHLKVRLGRHDEAEDLTRDLRREGPASLQGARLLLLLEIAVARQEPWVVELGRQAEAAGLDDHQRLRVSLLKVERAIRHYELERADALLTGLVQRAEALDDPLRTATAWMWRGDVARFTSKVQEAAACYDTALNLLPDGFSGRELGLRITLRRADLARMAGEVQEAVSTVMGVARAFAQLGCPLREAWALVRVVAMTAGRHPERAEALCQVARERFEAAQLASGIAAVDALCDSPGASLAWHLDQATELVRARHDAQRCRPPFERADADRPERRLGSHRLAIAACGPEVVEALANEMNECVRLARAGRERAGDPVVLRYVAAVDLLSAHRSERAAEVLIAHHHDQVSDGAMLRGLQAAIARCSNEAVVEGLLLCIEEPQNHPSSTVASAAELLGVRRERAALGLLLDLLERTRSASARKAAILALGCIGHRAVVDALVPSLGDPHLAEAAAMALLMLGDRRGVDFHAQALFDDQMVSLAAPGEIVGRYGGPENLLLLMQAARGQDERAVEALRGLGVLGDARGIPVLMDAVGARQRAVVEAAAEALQLLTGRVDDPSAPGARGRWGTWWELARPSFRPGVRYRHGAEFDCGTLIEGLGHRDPAVRRASYEELVIISGQALPFDLEGPWRIQEAHIHAWREWWRTYGAELPAGRWTLDGILVH